MEEHHTRRTPIIIFDWLHEDPNLSMTEAAFLADIHSLDTKGDGCFASSKWFGGRYRKSERRIEDMILRLRKSGHLAIVSRRDRKRWLRLVGPPESGGSHQPETAGHTGQIREATPASAGRRLYSNKEGNKEGNAAAGATGPSTGFGLVKGKAIDSSHAARLARRFEKNARLHRLLTSRQRPNFQKWKQAATDLKESAKSKRIAQVMDWYFENFRDDEWLPTVKSMPTFAEKFTSIEKAMRREDGGENSGFTTVTERELGNGETEVRIQYNE